MLTISFPGHPEARAIIVDELINGVSGIVECTICNRQMILTVSGTEEISAEIEEFIKSHKCLPLVRRGEVIALAERLKKSTPTMRITITKGKKIIKEL